ncbi:MAG: zinc metalloprotease HtpX [Gammaproteobacteria bacterium]|nr:zinc metalloprotease HtpX [Gammaproteobacteria bacterium]
MNSLFPAHYKLHNYLQSALLLAGMLGLLSLVGWLLAGPEGIGWFIVAGVFIFISAPRVTPAYILRLHRAQVLDASDAPQLYEMVHWLTKRAGMKAMPVLYYIPSSSINAFTTGLNKNASIALSDGMLRQLNTRELSGVLAHEISHVSRNDLLVMMVADVISRLTSIMAFAGYLLIWIYIPLFIFSGEKAPWLLLIILMTAPTFSILMQLALSRANEFNADVEAAKLTGDPLGLASALEKIDYYQGSLIQRIFSPAQRMHEPVFFRTHPLMIDRVNRLKQLANTMRTSDSSPDFAESQNWLKFPAPGHFPRRRYPGLWH